MELIIVYNGQYKGKWFHWENNIWMKYFKGEILVRNCQITFQKLSAWRRGKKSTIMAYLLQNPITKSNFSQAFVLKYELEYSSSNINIPYARWCTSIIPKTTWCTRSITWFCYVFLHELHVEAFGLQVSMDFWTRPRD